MHHVSFLLSPLQHSSRLQLSLADCGSHRVGTRPRHMAQFGESAETSARTLVGPGRLRYHRVGTRQRHMVWQVRADAQQVAWQTAVVIVLAPDLVILAHLSPLECVAIGMKGDKKHGACSNKKPKNVTEPGRLR